MRPLLHPGYHGRQGFPMADGQVQKPGIGIQGKGIFGKAVKFLIHTRSIGPLGDLENMIGSNRSESGLPTMSTSPKIPTRVIL
jgi:hypothetical protein